MKADKQKDSEERGRLRYQLYTGIDTHVLRRLGRCLAPNVSTASYQNKQLRNGYGCLGRRPVLVRRGRRR